MAAKHADEVIVLSEHMQKYFLNTYGRETLFISNGISKPEYRPVQVIKDRWGLEKESYFLFLARIVPEKGVHYLIEAYKNLKTDKKLVIAGGKSHTGEYFSQLIEMAAGMIRSSLRTLWEEGIWKSCFPMPMHLFCPVMWREWPSAFWKP